MNKIFTHTLVGVSALAVGGTAGYLIAKKRTEKHWQTVTGLLIEDWTARLNEAEGPAAIITSGENLQMPSDITVDSEGLSIKVETDEDVFDAPVMRTESYISDEAPKLIDLEEDFPVKTEVADDFTIEGEAPSVDARAFIEQYKNRSVDDFGGVSFPGQVEGRGDDAEATDVPLRTDPDFIVERDPYGPYVIAIDDFMDPATDPPFTKVEMRYFDGDDVLVDARDQPVAISTIGDKNKKRFGEGTPEPTQMYIRNERLSIDIEVTREAGLYLHEILGQDFSDKSPIHTMRESDDN